MRFIAFLLLLCFSASAGAIDYSRGVNVRDFGAKGDGVTDDTMAIQRALNFVRTTKFTLLLARQPMPVTGKEAAEFPILSSTGEDTLVPEVFFPAGNYKISETLAAGTYLYLRGEEGSVIVQSAPEKDILYISWGFRVQIRNLAFSGGRRQVILWTGNEDTANVTFENCRFEKSSGAAFFSHNFLNPARKDYATNSYGAYTLSWDGEKPVLTPNNENEKHCPSSTLFTFLNCEFIDCREVFRYNGDGSVIENCRIQMPAGAEPFPMNLRGALRIVNMQATTPEAIPGGAWISMGSSLITIENSTFKVEKGDGMSLLSIDMPVRRESQCYAMIRNTEFFSRKAPLIDCPNNMPNIVEALGVVNTSGSTVKLMDWASMPTEQSLKDSAFDISWAIKNIPGSHYSTTFPFNFTFAECKGVSAANLPPFLKRVQGRALSGQVFDGVFIPPVEITEQQMAAKFPRKLYATDYGVDLDPTTDDTAAMKKVLAAAADGEPALVVLPPVLIGLSDALELPVRVGLTAPGLATLKQSDAKKPVFRGKNQQLLWATNLRLASGSYGFEIETGAADKAQILIDKCLFYQQRECAVSVIAENNDNNTEFALRKSVFISPLHGVRTNAKHSELHDFWVSTNGRMNESAFITNLGGDMRITDMLGVPMPMNDHKYNHLPFVKDWPYAKDNRWFDNHGNLYANACRFGGEYYGMPLVFNFTKDGTLAIDSGMTCFSHPGMRQCMFYFVENPKLALARNVGWILQWPGAAAVKRPETNQKKPEIHVRNFQYEQDSFTAR